MLDTVVPKLNWPFTLTFFVSSWPKSPASQSIVSVELNKRGELEVVIRSKSNMIFCGGNPAPDRVVKQVYRSCDGAIHLVGGDGDRGDGERN